MQRIVFDLSSKKLRVKLPSDLEVVKGYPKTKKALKKGTVVFVDDVEDRSNGEFSFTVIPTMGIYDKVKLNYANKTEAERDGWLDERGRFKIA